MFKRLHSILRLPHPHTTPTMVSLSSIMPGNLLQSTSLTCKYSHDMIDHQTDCDFICQTKDPIRIRRPVRTSLANIKILETKEEGVQTSAMYLEDSLLFAKSTSGLSFESTIEYAIKLNISETNGKGTFKKTNKNVRFARPGEEEIIDGKNQEVVNTRILWYTKQELSLVRHEARSAVRAHKMVVTGHMPLEKSRVCVRGLEDYSSRRIRELKREKVEEAKRIVLDRQHDTNAKNVQLLYSRSSRWAQIVAHKLAIQDSIEAETWRR